MPLLAFLLIILAAVLHALWNFAAKKASGNLSVIWISLLIATIFLIPFLFLLSPKDIFVFKALPFVLATGTIHAFYFFFWPKHTNMEIFLWYIRSREEMPSRARR